MYDITDGIPERVKINPGGVVYGNFIEGNFDNVGIQPDGELYTTEINEI